MAVTLRWSFLYIPNDYLLYLTDTNFSMFCFCYLLVSFKWSSQASEVAWQLQMYACVVRMQNPYEYFCADNWKDFKSEAGYSRLQKEKLPFFEGQWLPCLMCYDWPSYKDWQFNNMLVEMVMTLEEEFKIGVEEESSQSITTVLEAAELIEKLVEKKTA